MKASTGLMYFTILLISFRAKKQLQFQGKIKPVVFGYNRSIIKSLLYFFRIKKSVLEEPRGVSNSTYNKPHCSKRTFPENWDVKANKRVKLNTGIAIFYF